MKKEVLEKIILDSIKKCSGEFQKDELAYLALTSKIEIPIRDKWAYLMQRNLKEQKIRVAREWKRSDIAIIQDNYPLVIIELSAMYTFDALNTLVLKKYIVKIEKDEKKAKELTKKETANEKTLVYTVLLATHPLSSISKELESIIAYNYQINRSLKKFNSSEIYKNAKDNIEKSLKNKNMVAQGIISGGGEFAIDIEVAYWIMRA